MRRMVVTIQLDKLTVVVQNESAHDEPYLWLAFIKVDGSTFSISDSAHSSATIHSPAGSHGNLGPAGSEMNQGDSVAIPKALGRWRTPMLTIPDGDGMDDLLSAITLVIVGLEQDDTPDDAAEQGHQAFVSVLRSEVNKAIQSMKKPDVNAITEEAKAAIINAIKAASVSVWTVLPISNLFTIGALVDSDDFIGSNVREPFTFKQIHDAGPAGIPFGLLDLVVPPIDNGFYQVTGKVSAILSLSVRRSAALCGKSLPLSLKKSVFAVGAMSSSLWDHLAAMEINCAP